MRLKRHTLGALTERANRSSQVACLTDALSVLAFNHLRTAGTPEGDAYLALFKAAYEPSYSSLVEEYPGFAAVLTATPNWDSLLPIFVLMKAGIGLGPLTPMQTDWMTYLQVGLPFTDNASKRAWHARLLAMNPAQLDWGTIEALTPVEPGTAPTEGARAPRRAGDPPILPSGVLLTDWTTPSSRALAQLRANLTQRTAFCRTSGVSLVGPFEGMTSGDPVVTATSTKKSSAGPFLVGAGLAFILSRFF